MNDDKPVNEEEARQRAELDHLTAAAGNDEAVSGEWEPGPDQFGQGDRGGQGGPKTADVLAPILMITFSLVAGRKGAHWALSEAEASEAAGAYADVLDKYAPDVAVGPELTALLVTAMLVAPRIGEDKRREAARAAAEREKAAGKKQGGSDGDMSE